MEMETGLSSTRFQVSPDTLVKSFHDNIALVHMKHRRIHLLNTTATAIWNLVAAGKSRDEIQQGLLQEFDVAEADLSTEIDRTLAFLGAEGFIQIHE